MENKKLKVAITGSIGSGKSAFCSMLEVKGFTVLKADDISKEILKSDKSVKEKISKLFGENSFKNGVPDKKYLAKKVFSDPKNVVKINSILHPKVIEIISKKTDDFLLKNDLVFVEAALIYEADMEYLFDYVVLISADEKIRMNRKHNILSSEEFLKRNENQIPDEEKRKRADFIFENNGSLEDLKSKADLLILILSNN